MKQPKHDSGRLIDLAISPFDEAYKSIIGLPFGEGDVRAEPQRRTLFLTHEIDEYIALAFDSLLQQLCSAQDAPIYVIFNCPGGSTVDGFGMHDALRLAGESGSPVTGTVRGQAQSMTPIILQGCSVRRMTENSYMMIHQGWGEIFGNTTEVEAEAKWWRDMERRAERILASRSTLTAREIHDRIQSANWYLTAKDALKYGFVDELI